MARPVGQLADRLVLTSVVGRALRNRVVEDRDAEQEARSSRNGALVRTTSMPSIDRSVEVASGPNRKPAAPAVPNSTMPAR